jgi:glycosyltransferase involved in cell wall biosynthesis
MDIIFDPQIFSLQKYGGISRYFTGLAASMFQSQEAGVEIHCPHYSTQYLKDVSPRVFAAGEDISAQRLWGFRRQFYTAANLASFRKRLAQSRFDVAHHTYYWPLPDSLPVRARVTTIHDMIDEVIAPSPLKSRLKLRSIRQADHVICVSEYTRKTLLGLYDIAPDKVSVVHLGRPQVVPDVSSENPAGRPYILHVGPRAGYKNFDRLLAAYAASDRLKQDFRLACFGGGPLTAAEKSACAARGIAVDDLLRFTGDDVALHAAYKGAALFVYPSLYEGFGLPPLEAMTLGAPVACSNLTSIPEIVGDAGEYFDPADTESITGAMEAVLYSGARRRELIRLGHERALGFGWDRCARETLDIYKAIV